jgi:hypothetical protein
MQVAAEAEQIIKRRANQRQQVLAVPGVAVLVGLTRYPLMLRLVLLALQILAVAVVVRLMALLAAPAAPA